MIYSIMQSNIKIATITADEILEGVDCYTFLLNTNVIVKLLKDAVEKIESSFIILKI